jgi:hypothetical protein
MALLETGAGIGLVAPGELAVVIGGVTAGHGHTNLLLLIAIVWVCALAGDRSEARPALRPPARRRGARDLHGLAVIAAALIVTTIASVLEVRRDPSARAQAGALRKSVPDQPAARAPAGRRPARRRADRAAHPV